MCGKGGLPDEALRLFQRMLAEGIAPNAITYNALIHASAGGGLKTGDASAPFSDSEGVAQEVGAAVSDAQGAGGRGAGGERRWDRVMPLIDEMQKAG